MSVVPAGVVLMLAGLVLPLFKGPSRSFWLLLSPLVTLVAVWQAPEAGDVVPFLAGLELQPVRGDALGRLFATIFTLMAFGGALFALRQGRDLELGAAFVYAGGAVGVAMAGDLLTLFVFWEIMAVASTLVIIAGADGPAMPRQLQVAMRYLLVHALGGTLLLFGIAAHVATTGSTAVEQFDAGTAAGALILGGVLINAAAPPLSAWLADAYPSASWSGTVFLSAFTTKAAVYVLIRSFPGTEILIPVGLFMALYGIVYALLENDMRRILAYSIVNQVGFMVTGVGIGTALALNGASAHAFAHIIYKALLLMSAGSVVYMTGKHKCTDLGGLFRTMPLTCICGTIGALAISSFPFTSGFVSKSMISSAAAYEHLAFVWFVLMAASAGVFLHAGIKFPWFVFFQKDSGMRPPDPPRSMQAAMVLFAALCIGIGVFPGPLYALLPFEATYEPYTGAHLVEMLQLLLFSGLAFFLLLPWMKRTLTITVDFDWLYRRLWPRVWPELRGMIAWMHAAGARAVGNDVRQAIDALTSRFGAGSRIAATASTEALVVPVVVLLGIVAAVEIFLSH